MDAAPAEAVIRFLKRRYASAIGRGDERTASRLRVELDRLLNGPDADPGSRGGDLADDSGPRFPELPPAA